MCFALLLISLDDSLSDDMPELCWFSDMAMKVLGIMCVPEDPTDFLTKEARVATLTRLPIDSAICLAATNEKWLQAGLVLMNQRHRYVLVYLVRPPAQ